MRNIFCETMVKHSNDPNFIFLTGDLGYMALEPLQKAAGPRFINAGVSEQNMISVAAGLASQGLLPWAYSIAPFIYARPLEQVRNDVCIHDLPVKLVGNGGGYGYGVMGASHHAIDDYGILLTLLNMYVFVPAFRADIPPIVERLIKLEHPSYLRLGKDEQPKNFDLPPYAPWRHLLKGDGPTLLIVGPLAGEILNGFKELPPGDRPSVWVLTELPIVHHHLPAAFKADLERSNHLVVAEEHVAHGGVGEMLSRVLMLAGEAPKKFSHYCAQGYVSGFYGSQNFHRKESNLTAETILKELKK
ncbi:MAG TPA: transketolase [bacterium]|nr:transketolase [bacterium]